MSPQRHARFEELEQRFSQLEPKLEEGPVKEAFSLLNGMVLQIRRQGASALASHDGQSGDGSGRVTLDDIANLYKSAPDMSGHAEKQGLPVGNRAPDFNLPDATGQQVRLSDFQGKNVVLAFYPLDWSPACSDQLSLYQSELEEFERHNTQVIAISVDSIYSHGAWAAVRGITFPLLSDFHPKGEVAQHYQVLRDSTGFTERALFVIDADGIIRYKHISPELHQIPDIYELFEQLQPLSQADQPAAARGR
jgi:peroxiredoxin